MNCLQGNLKYLPIPILFREIYKFKKTGTLILKCGGCKKIIGFKEGRIIFAQSNLENEKLGNEILKNKYISEKDLHFALSEKKNKLLGEYLISKKILDANKIRTSLLNLYEKIIYSTFNWNRGIFHFIPEKSAIKSSILINTPLPQLIVNGIRSIKDYNNIKEFFLSKQTIFYHSKEFIFHPENISLKREEKMMLELIRNNSTLDEIKSSINVASEIIYKSLLVLYSLGIIKDEFTDINLNNQRKEIINYYYFVKRRNYYDILGLKKNSSTSDIALSYINLYKKYYLFLVKNPINYDLMFYVEEILKALNEAYRILRYDLSRKAYDEILKNKIKQVEYFASEEKRTDSLANKQKAYKFYQLADEAGNKGAIDEKIFFLKKSCELDPQNSFYLFNLGYALSFEKGQLKDGEKFLLDSIKIEPNNSECWFYLSQLYKNLGFLYRSEAALKEAIRLDRSYEKYEKDKIIKYISLNEFKRKITYIFIVLIFLIFLQMIFTKNEEIPKPPFLINKKVEKRL